MKNSNFFRSLFLVAFLLLQLSALCFHSHGAAGDVDQSFLPASNVNGPVSALVVQPDGKVLALSGGNLLSRLKPDGTTDTNFSADIFGDWDQSTFFDNTTILAFALQTDGRILVAGLTTHFVPEPDCPYYPNCPGDTYTSDFIMRLQSNGARDSSFSGATLDGPAYAIALQSDGRVLVGGGFLTMSGVIRRGIARLNANGTLDTNYNIGGGLDLSVPLLAVQSDGKAIIGGRFTTFSDTNCSSLARLNANGSLDGTFNSGYGVRHYRDCGGDVCYNVTFPTAVTVQPNGKVLVGVLTENWQCDPFEGGCFVSESYSVTRLKADGSSDSSFHFTNVVNNVGLLGYVQSIAVQSDGKIIVGSSGIQNAVRTARLNADGSWDNTFNSGSGPNGGVNAVALQSNGNILIGGDFTTVNGVVRPYMARLFGDAAAPSLKHVRSNALVTISWPVTSLNFQLQQTANLSLPNSWLPVSGSTVTNAGHISVSLPTVVGSRFFRLQSQ